MKTENNKLLAEFLGWGKFETFEDSEEYVLTDVEILNLRVGDFNIFGLKEMKFNTSWDWLMLVVDKIETLDCVIESRIDRGYIGIVAWGKEDFKRIDFSLEDYESKIEATYNACIAFVKWYNDNK